jgi:hypothetical protein
MREKGSRYILLVAFILSITNPIEKRLVTMSDPLTQAFSYCLGLCILFAILVWARHADCRTVMRTAPKWAVLAGVMDATAPKTIESRKTAPFQASISRSRACVPRGNPPRRA